MPRPRSTSLRALVFLTQLLGAACGSRKAEPTQTHGATEPSSTATTNTSASASAESSAPSQANNQENAWVKCAHGFRATSTVQRDLQRLGMLCGPAHGMRPLGKPVVAQASEQQRIEQKINLKRESCIRVFVVGSSGVGKIRVEILTPDQTVVSQTTQERSWVMSPEDKAYCATNDTDLLVRSYPMSDQAELGQQVWLLP